MAALKKLGVGKQLKLVGEWLCLRSESVPNEVAVVKAALLVRVALYHRRRCPALCAGDGPPYEASGEQL